MKAIKFKEQNIIFSKPEGMSDKECSSLPAYSDGKGEIICVWHMSIIERIKVLFTGNVWFGVLCLF